MNIFAACFLAVIAAAATVGAIIYTFLQVRLRRFKREFSDEVRTRLDNDVRLPTGGQVAYEGGFADGYSTAIRDSVRGYRDQLDAIYAIPMTNDDAIALRGLLGRSLHDHVEACGYKYTPAMNSVPSFVEKIVRPTKEREAEIDEMIEACEKRRAKKIAEFTGDVSAD